MKRQPGYYPNFHVLDQRKYWDAATRKVIEQRLQEPPIHFFSADQLPIITAICDRMLPQDDRAPDVRIPVVSVIDERLAKNQISGQRYADMPSDREAYALGIQAVDETARKLRNRSFKELDPVSQDSVLNLIRNGEPSAANAIWEQMSIKRFWTLLLGDCLTAYYSHPWAWDEIGFGGPSYPRGYMRLENGLPEPWETDEERYEWQPPVATLSDETTDNL